MNWQESLLKYAKIAWDSGKTLEFTVIKRDGKRFWKVYLRSIIASGEEVVDEDDN